MRDSKYGHFWTGALVALIAVFSTHALDANSAKRSASQVLLSAEDYIEIQQLYGMYARDVDPGSVRDASWMFTNGAVVNIAGVKPMTTPDQIKALDGWRIRERVWSADSFRGSALPVTASPVPGDRRTDSTGGEANKD